MDLNISFDEKKLQRGFVDIQKANTIATRNTLNTMAAITRRNAINNLESDFINRNTFTKRQIQFQKTESEKISSMESRTGATEKASYMALQEEGGTNRPQKQSKTVHVPTNRARGGSRSGLITKNRRINRLKTAGYGRKKKPTSRKARTFRRAAIAHSTGKFLRLKSGIYKVTSMKENSFKTKMIYNTMNRTTRVQSNPWLEPATEKPIRDGQAIYNSQIDKLLKLDVI